MIYIIWQYFYTYESFLLEGSLKIISLNVLSVILIIMALSPGVSFMYKGETITLKKACFYEQEKPTVFMT